MKIKVTQLEPNPFRRMDHYPINRAKVTALKNSITETGFWDNIVVREHPAKAGKYQIAYGHHRLQAVQECGIKEVDVPVRDLDDCAMLRIMANENMDEWKSNVAVTNETVLAAKEFIEATIEKAGRNYRQLPAEIAKLWASEDYFVRATMEDARKNPSIVLGCKIITRFLGANWSEQVVGDALAILNDDTIDRAAVEEFKSPAHADTFRRAVKTVNERAGETVIPKREQHALAREIKKQISEEEKSPNHREITAQKIESKVFQRMADVVKKSPVPQESLQAILGAEEFGEWSSWMSILSKIQNRKQIFSMSKKARDEIQKLMQRCIDAISEKRMEVE